MQTKAHSLIESASLAHGRGNVAIGYAVALLA